MANFADRFRAKTAAAPAEGELTADQQALLAEFEKQASDNGINIDELSEEDVGELFQEFLTDLEASVVDDEPADKVAEAQNLIVLREFEKAAAAANLDLSALSEDEVNQAFMHWLGASVEDIEQEEEVKVASAKLAEVEVLGNHMADVFIGRVNAGLNKEAGIPSPGDVRSAWKAARGAGVGRVAAAREIGGDAVREIGSSIRDNKGKVGLGVGAAGAAGVAAAMKRKKDKTASAIESLVEIARIKNGQ